MLSETLTTYRAGEVDKETISRAIEDDGYIIIEKVLNSEFINQAKIELEAAIETETEYHKTSDYQDYGMVLLCALYGGSFFRLFDNKDLMLPFNTILGDGSIVYAYTSSSMPPDKSNYSNRVHVDCPRVIPGYVTNMGATILLDHFTEENGSTWFLPKSQTSVEEPSEEYFYKHAKRLIEPAGTVWFFNARIWHAGGNNLTPNWRHAITINMARPYMKQRIDIPRALSHLDLSDVSEEAKQKLGFYAQVPASLEEYYLPPEQRKFKQKTE